MLGSRHLDDPGTASELSPLLISNGNEAKEYVSMHEEVQTGVFVDTHTSAEVADPEKKTDTIRSSRSVSMSFEKSKS